MAMSFFVRSIRLVEWRRAGACTVRRLFVWLLALGMLVAASATANAPDDSGTLLRPWSPQGVVTPPLAPISVFPVQMVLDDGGAEGVFGLAGGTAREFLWFNRFDSPGSFQLEEIWVLFPSGPDVPLGGAVQIVVYLDPDGDPTTGANLLATYDETIQSVDGTTFSVFPLPSPLTISDPGDVLIGVVNRYFDTGVDVPPTLPAAVDTTASQSRSYFALWPGDAADPPDLSSATSIGLLTGSQSGNFMIRGFGSVVGGTAIPTLGTLGFGFLALLLAGLGIGRLRRFSVSR